MIPTTNEYITAIKADERKTYPLLICELNSSVDSYPFALVTATSEKDSQHTANLLVNGRIRQANYISFGYAPWNLRYSSLGWESAEIAGSDGVLAIPQVIEIDYLKTISATNFICIGLQDSFPVDFTMEYSIDGVTYSNLCSVTGNTNYLYSYNTTERSFRYIRITVTKTQGDSSVKIVQAGAVCTIVFDIYDIDEIKLLEELSMSNDSPLGLVCSNTCEFRLSNENKLTSEDNSLSPFYRIMKNEFKFKPYIGVETATNEFEFIPLGVFWGKFASKESDEITSSFMGVDIISKIKSISSPIYQISYNTTVYQLFKDLFRLIGLDESEYFVSKKLNQPVSYGFFSGEVGSNFANETVGECLQVLAEAGNCYITSDRFGRIKVKSNFKSSDDDVITLTDDDFIFATKNLKDVNNTFDAVKVHYRIPEEATTEKIIFEKNDFYLKSGLNIIEFESPDPVLRVSRIVLENSVNSYLSSSETGAIKNRLNIYTTAAEKINLKVYGFTLQVYNTSYQANATENEPVSILKISNWLIQDEQTAKNFTDSILQYSAIENNSYEIKERGDPRREAGDLIRIDDNTNQIDEYLQIVKQEITWNGFLESLITARKPVQELKWLFLFPWFPVQQNFTEPEQFTEYCYFNYLFEEEN